MSFINTVSSVGTDDRVRKYILPQRIVQTSGLVKREELLLKEKPLQIALAEPELTVLKNGEDGENAWVLLDFGCELHGGIRLLTANAGLNWKKVRLTFGESVSEAMSDLREKNAGNDHSPRDFEVVVPNLSDLTFGETGFRFVKIELLDRNTEIRLKSAVAVFVYRELEYRGSFRCNDEEINKIYDTAAYTCHLNMQNYLWDGIKRDRLVWVGDTHPEMLAIRVLFGNDRTVIDNLRFSREEARLPGWMNGIPAYSLWWLIITENWCRHNGDYSFVEESREYIT